MKWIALSALSLLFVSCSGFPESVALLSTASVGASALTGRGMTIEVNVMSKNVTNTCTCRDCGK